MTDLHSAAGKELNAVLDEIWREYGPGELEPGEFTVRDLAEEKDVTYDVAKHALERAVRTGRLTRRKLSGSRAWAYRSA